MQQLNQNELEMIESLVQSVGIPSPPNVVLELSKLFESDAPAPKDVAHIIQKDAALVAKTLTAINSPTFALRCAVSSAQHAYTLMGPTTFQVAVLASALHDSLTSYGIDEEILEKYWQHSTNTAEFCHALALRLHAHKGKLINAEHAYLLGLFHDIGEIMLLKHNAKYVEILKESSNRHLNLSRLERAFEIEEHSKVGFVSTEKWKLDGTIRHCILKHHIPFNDPSNNEKEQIYLALLSLAEFLSLQLHKDSYLEQNYQSKSNILDELHFLGIDTQCMKDILEERQRKHMPQKPRIDEPEAIAVDEH
ncbi:MAG: HDOD domain-containing protein [Zetaproteobacteria bacterium]|nr:HDOD domain-containing protein [Zetaproteobacteria bacterium]